MHDPKFYWLAVFEMIIGMPVATGPEGTEDGQPAVQLVSQKWSRTGEVTIAPGRPTDDVLAEVVKNCKEAGGVPDAALLVNYTINPMFLNPEVSYDL